MSVQKKKARKSRKNAFAEAANIAPLKKIIFDFPADRSGEFVISCSQLTRVERQILRGMVDLHYQLFSVVWVTNKLPHGDLSSLMVIAFDAELRKADIEACIDRIWGTSFDEVLSPETDKAVAQIFSDVAALAAANALRALTSLEAKDYERCIACHTRAVRLAQLMAEAVRRIDIFFEAEPRISFSRLGTAGAKKRHAPMAELRKWAVEQYRKGTWRSANQAAHVLKAAIIAHGRSINAHLSEENAQRTIADWFRASV